MTETQYLWNDNYNDGLYIKKTNRNLHFSDNDMPEVCGFLDDNKDEDLIIIRAIEYFIGVIEEKVDWIDQLCISQLKLEAENKELKSQIEALKPKEYIFNWSKGSEIDEVSRCDIDNLSFIVRESEDMNGDCYYYTEIWYRSNDTLTETELVNDPREAEKQAESWINDFRDDFLKQGK